MQKIYHNNNRIEINYNMVKVIRNMYVPIFQYLITQNLILNITINLKIH